MVVGPYLLNKPRIFKNVASQLQARGNGESGSFNNSNFMMLTFSSEESDC